MCDLAEGGGRSPVEVLREAGWGGKATCELDGERVLREM